MLQKLLTFLFIYSLTITSLHASTTVIYADEAVLMSEAGMPNAEVLVSATVNAADLIGMSEQLGTIEIGKQADIIATGGSPIDDIKQLLGQIDLLQCCVSGIPASSNCEQQTSLRRVGARQRNST